MLSFAIGICTFNFYKFFPLKMEGLMLRKIERDTKWYLFAIAMSMLVSYAAAELFSGRPANQAGYIGHSEDVSSLIERGVIALERDNAIKMGRY